MKCSRDTKDHRGEETDVVERQSFKSNIWNSHFPLGFLPYSDIKLISETIFFGEFSAQADVIHEIMDNTGSYKDFNSIGNFMETQAACYRIQKPKSALLKAFTISGAQEVVTEEASLSLFKVTEVIISPDEL
ncbi:hypothetical protein ACHAPJ_000300 [Fusarium lateritium]